MPKHPINRRQFLYMLFGFSSGAVACSCGVLSSTLWALNIPTALPPTPIPTPSLTATPSYPQPDIITRRGWGALPPDHTATNEFGFYSEDNPEGWRVYDGDLREIYRTVVIHHSVLDDDNELVILQDVQDLHRVDRGWADIAYHFLVGKSGQIYEGRAITARGTHVAGYNTGSLGICLLGNFVTTAPSVAQIDATQRLINWAAASFALSHIAGHNQFNLQTECPGSQLTAVLPLFAASAGLEMGIEGYVAPNTVGMIPCPTCGNTVL